MIPLDMEALDVIQNPVPSFRHDWQWVVKRRIAVMNCPFGCRVSNYPNAQRICQHHWPEKEARFVEPHPPSHLSASVQRERSRKYWIEALSCRKNCSHPSTNCMRSLS